MERCATLKPQEHIPSLGLAENFPGFTYCRESGGGVKGGCIPFLNACTFFRVFIYPKDLKVFELFDCLA